LIGGGLLHTYHSSFSTPDKSTLGVAGQSDKQDQPSQPLATTDQQNKRHPPASAVPPGSTEAGGEEPDVRQP
jgi:hypothetical protein